MKPLRLYWLKKGKQELNIGDNIKHAFDDPKEFNDPYSYDVLDWNFDFENMAKLITLDFQTKRELNHGKDMINSNLYICSACGTIRGIIPINKKKN